MALTNRFFTDAFRDMHRAFSLLEDPNFFDDARRSLGSASNLGSLTRYPATDIHETSEGYELHAELPGYDKNNIHIDITDDRTLLLSGSIQSQRESSSDDGQQQQQQTTTVSKDVKSPTKWLVNERVSGSFQRSFSFPAPVDSSGIKASFENGVLKVLVPKAANQGKRRIQID
ncbi:hypothetical protein G6F57_011552 [Rhizopus arrhizus]|nr:hypothetical protein G6F23_003965 [Rhizopus arrhizus]KAG1411440.1 hypothetical protein G6F58_008554 [Rhizopus delemar]KAG0759918.1 hypothetical protein G6F24_008712 [Rhizopus arrhizus]KAG0789037.1 hypothetical protein G6F21_006785 [Rhizopus arrhizus]KAG0800426.1 hypothetical protein G6F22_002243 [Rhizopus arrhizus]